MPLRLDSNQDLILRFPITKPIKQEIKGKHAYFTFHTIFAHLLFISDGNDEECLLG